MEDEEEVFGQLNCSENWADYQPYFDHEWATRFIQRAEVIGLLVPAMSLLLLWKGSSLVRSSSWLLAASAAETINSQLYSNEPLGGRLLKTLATKLESRTHVGGIFIDHHIRAGLLRAIQEAHDEARANFARRPVQVTPSDLWRAYLEKPDFKLTLWHAEMAAINQLYFAYENFITDCMKHQYGYKTLQGTGLKSAINEHLPPGAFQEVFGDRLVVFAKNVRNASVHNGGRVTPNLKPFRDLLITDEQDRISIAPNQTAELFVLFKQKVEAFLGRLAQAGSD